MSLRIAPDLDLDDAFATEGVLVVGMRGSGKSNTEVRWAEVLDAAGIPFTAVDPKGDWWGVRSSADGKTAGLSVPVFGGLHGDFPLEGTAAFGRALADLLVDQNVSAVLDVSRLSKTGERPAFLTAFFDQLMERHQREPHARCVILEEAHSYIPQTVTGPTARLKEAAASILLEGRAFGLGCWAATQRPARLHKDVVEEVGTAVIHRIGAAATNDKKTVSGWLKEHDGGELAASITKLAAGEAIVLSPEFDIVGRFQIDRRTTFDSGATPKAGSAVRKPQTMADIDPAAIQEALAATIEKAKAEDPKELQKQLREARQRIIGLEGDVDALRRERAERPAEVEVQRIEVPVLDEKLVIRLEESLQPAAGLLAEVQERLAWEVHQRGEVLEFERRLHDRQGVPRARAAGGAAGQVGERGRTPQRADPPARREPSRPPVSRAAPATGGDADGDLSPAEREILVALAQSDSGWNGQDLAVLVGKRYSGGFRNYLSALRTRGHIVGANKDAMRITDAGVAALGDYEPLPTGRALLEHWLDGDRLTPAEKDVLRALDAEPGLAGPELAAACGKEYSGGFRNYLSKLRTLRLIVGSNTGGMQLADLLEGP